MPLSNELRQRLVLVLQKQGTESIDEVRGLMRELQGEFTKAGEALRDAFISGQGDIVEFTKLTAELTREYNELAKIIKGVEEIEAAAQAAAGEAMRKRIEGWARAQSEAERYQATLKDMAAAEVAAAENSAMEQHLRDMAELQERLGAMERQAAAERAEGERQAAAAMERGSQAVRDRMEQLDRQRQAEGDALRERAEGYARIERMGEEQLERERQEARDSLLAQKEAAGQAIRDRAEMHARLERMAEQANAEAKRQLGDSIRAAAERHARIEEMEEEQHRQNLARMDAEFKASESLANQKALFQRLNSKGLNDEQAKALNNLTASIKDGAKFTDEFVQKFNQLGGGMNAAEQKSKNLAMGLMAIAHAGQDAQYGFGAVVNNIPQIAYAMANAIPAMEKYAMQFSAIAMIGGTLLNVALPKIKEFVTTFATEMGMLPDPVRTAAVTVDQLKAKIEALSSKSYKVDVDYATIAMAEKRLKDLEAALKTAEQMAQSRTSVQEESARVFKDAVTEGGGSVALERGLAAAMANQGMFKDRQQVLRAIDEQRARAEKNLAESRDPDEINFLTQRVTGLQEQSAALRKQIKTEVDTKVRELIGRAGQGDKNALADISAFFGADPGAFAMAGMDRQKLGAGLMAADPQFIKDERESRKFAEQQAADAKRRKKLDDDIVDDLNRQGQAADADVKRIMDRQKQRDDQLREQARAADGEMKRREQEQKEAAREAAKNQRADAADARAMGQLLRNNAAADQKAAKVQAAEELAGRFGDFSPDFAAHGGRMLRDRLNRGQPEQAAFNAVYMELLKTAANQEKQTGMLGEATQRLMMLEQHNRLVQARLNQIQGQMGRGRNRNPTLLPHPAQR